jgi:sortase (surface protein transpeptidase)
MDPTREPIVTLISCYPYRINTDRIVVVAELVE